ncbi:MAG: pyruvate ferredoxin oxidoreductase subunit gamma [Deltaproteobacteria bacterium]|nr:pyruvate ferredoxin oxidoreductase subunit gamma [Deltaproteobacteria bacterium]
MLEIRLHGRGGQGAVTSAELIAISAINKGKFAQAFPSFGPERRGAPVVAFCRVDEKKINIRAKVYSPDIVIVLDPGLLELANPTEGIRDGGLLVINSNKAPEEFGDEIPSSIKIATVDANRIALEELGRPIVNTTLIGAFIKANQVITIDDIRAPMLERFGPKLGGRNMKALERAYREVIIQE